MARKKATRLDWVCVRWFLAGFLLGALAVAGAEGLSYVAPCEQEPADGQH